MSDQIKNKQLLVNSDFNFNNQKLINLSDPVSSTDAVNLRSLLASKEYGKEYTDTLFNNTNGSLSIGAISEHRFLEIKYTVGRNGIYQSGNVEMFHDGVTVESNHSYMNVQDIGVSFGARIFSGNLYLTYSVNDNNNDCTIKYVLFKITI